MKKPRKPKPLTYQVGGRMAVSYLQRFPASIHRFREVMARKIARESRAEAEAQQPRNGSLKPSRSAGALAYSTTERSQRDWCVAITAGAMGSRRFA